jgi:hypothetical protein
MIHGVRLLVVALMPIALYAGEANQDELSANQAKWHALGIATYAFTIWAEGGLAGSTPIRMTVRDGEFASARVVHYTLRRESPEFALESHEGEEIEAPGLPQTVPALFALAAEYLRQADTNPRVYFHPSLGFPMRLERHVPMSADGIDTYVVAEFEVLK